MCSIWHRIFYRPSTSSSTARRGPLSLNSSDSLTTEAVTTAGAYLLPRSGWWRAVYSAAWIDGRMDKLALCKQFFSTISIFIIALCDRSPRKEIPSTAGPIWHICDKSTPTIKSVHFNTHQSERRKSGNKERTRSCYPATKCPLSILVINLIPSAILGPVLWWG